jgi:hypothetical protein
MSWRSAAFSGSADASGKEGDGLWCLQGVGRSAKGTRSIGMTGEKFTIVKCKYRVFEGDTAIGEPMDEMTEQHLRGWLLSRGFSELETNRMIEHTDDAQSITITLP